MWCPTCKEEHGSQDLVLVLIQDLVTGGEQLHTVDGQEGLDTLQQDVSTEETDFVLLEAMALCRE